MGGMQLAENSGPKSRQKIAIWAPAHNFVKLYLRNQGMYRRYRQSEKKLVKQQYAHQMSPTIWRTNG